MRSTPSDEEIAGLIRTIAGAQQMAERLELDFLRDLLSAAVLEAALNGEGGRSALGDPRTRLESLLSTKLRMALGRDGANVVMFRDPRGGAPRRPAP